MKWSWLLLLLLLLPIVTATSFNVEIEPFGRTILLNESAEFNLTVSNAGDDEFYFEIYSPDVAWDLRTEPTEDIILKVPAKGKKTTKLLLNPLYVNTGYYGIIINVKKSGTNEVERRSVEVGLTHERVSDFLPAVKPTLVMQDIIDPREEIPIKLVLENQNRRNIKKMDVKIRSDLINKDYTTNLQPLQKKEIEFNASLDPYTTPREDFLQVSVFTYANNRTIRFDLTPYHFSVKYWGELEKEEEINSKFLATEKIIKVANNGNDKSHEIIMEKTNFFKRLFTSTNPSSVIESSSSGTYIVFDLKLDPGESAEIVIKSSYRTFFALVLIIFIFVLVYFVIRSPISVTKAAMVVETKEGGISELKVIINIKNRSTHSLHDLVIQDLVPHIAEVKKDFEVGTLKPEKILTHEKKGTQLKWSISELDGHEERILSYKVRTHLSVLGGLKLPPARITYRFFKYTRKVYSNLENLFAR